MESEQYHEYIICQLRLKSLAYLIERVELKLVYIVIYTSRHY
jgi:hypothetical protein